jgi:hypothetical protein
MTLWGNSPTKCSDVESGMKSHNTTYVLHTHSTVQYGTRKVRMPYVGTEKVVSATWKQHGREKEW